MDIVSPQDRSRNMSKIKSKKTSIELYIRKLLYNEGFRYRINYQKIEGKPDIYFIGRKVAVFIHGCFWHRHKNCRIAYTPKSNIEFWSKKFESNIIRDLFVQQTLQNEHIRCLIIWECTIRKMKKDKNYEQKIISDIKTFLEGCCDSLEL